MGILKAHSNFCYRLTDYSRSISEGCEPICARLFTFALLLSFCVNLFGAGFLRVRNFSREVYQGGPQNWAFAQDSIGRVYFGNRDGLLSFDGERWSKFVLPNRTTIRSLLYVEDESRIYAGGTDEFGYYEPEKITGALKFRSLRHTLPKSAPAFTEVWNIHKTGNIVYFQTDNHLFRHDGKMTTVIKSPGRISTSSLIDGHIYIGLETGGLYELSGSDLLRIPGSEVLSGCRIQVILPGMGQFMVATPVNGLFIYVDGRIIPFESDINGFLKENQLFCGATDGKNYVFGTVSRGAVVKDFSKGITKYVNRDSGMLNNTVLNAAFDVSGNIWLGLDNGLDYVLFNSPVSSLVGASNDVGAGYSSYLFGNTLFMGTNQGLYSTYYPFGNRDSTLPLHKELQGQVWSVTEAPGGFFVAGDAGLFVYNGTGFYRIPGLGGGYRVRLLPNDSRHAVAACYDGFHLLSEDAGIWRRVGKIGEDHGVHGDFEFDRYGNIWSNNWLKGLYRLQPDSSLSRFARVKLYGPDAGLPAVNGNSIITYQGDIVVSTAEGLYGWNRASDRFVRHPQLNSILKPGQTATLHVTVTTHSLALLDREGLRVSTTDSSGNIREVSAPLRGYRESIVKGFEHVNVITTEEVLIGTQQGFWLINPSVSTSESNSLMQPFVNTVIANMDSLVYRAPMKGSTEDIRLSYDLRSLRFELGYPDFEAPGDVAFSTFLENYDKEWSPYSKEASREYTRLSEGSYILHIRVRNQNTEEIVESEFYFSVAPPWYRSVAAKIIYSLMLIVAVLLVIWFAHRWKARAELKMELEKEEELRKLRRQAEQEALKKDYEIASLKSEQLENDIRHKSGELSTATMNLIRKNEILTNLGSKISKIQGADKLDPGVKRQLDQLQTMIRENISHDDVWTDFSRNFDIVYQNYTQRLHDRYSLLTSADIRICCYIKMGLSSKDMAPLLNITVKSVEMARYRLRKKMELSPEQSLTEYLTNF